MSKPHGIFLLLCLLQAIAVPIGAASVATVANEMVKQVGSLHGQLANNETASLFDHLIDHCTRRNTANHADLPQPVLIAASYISSAATHHRSKPSAERLCHVTCGHSLTKGPEEVEQLRVQHL